jgi:hypothetical protein
MDETQVLSPAGLIHSNISRRVAIFLLTCNNILLIVSSQTSPISVDTSINKSDSGIAGPRKAFVINL